MEDLHLCSQLCPYCVEGRLLTGCDACGPQVLDKILLGQKLSTYVPGLEDAVEWLYSKNSVRVPKELTSSETGSDDDDSMVHVL